MSARASQGSGTAAGCFGLLAIAWLLIGCVVFVAAYGEPQSFSLTLIIVVLVWPAALVWWSLKWIAIAVVAVLACIGIKHLWDGL